MTKIKFLGYFKIKDLPQNVLCSYTNIIGKVCKVYKDLEINELMCKVKGHFNSKTKSGLYYLPKVYEKESLFDNYVEINIYNFNYLERITKEEYENYIFEMKKIYLIKGFHPEDINERIYHFKSPIKIKENTKIIVDTKFGEQELIVTDCKMILEDQEEEYLEKFQLKKFRKVLSVIEETEVVKKEVKEKPIEWE